MPLSYLYVLVLNRENERKLPAAWLHLLLLTSTVVPPLFLPLCLQSLSAHTVWKLVKRCWHQKYVPTAMSWWNAFQIFLLCPCHRPKIIHFICTWSYFPCNKQKGRNYSKPPHPCFSPFCCCSTSEMSPPRELLPHVAWLLIITDVKEYQKYEQKSHKQHSIQPSAENLFWKKSAFSY